MRRVSDGLAGVGGGQKRRDEEEGRPEREKDLDRG